MLQQKFMTTEAQRSQTTNKRPLLGLLFTLFIAVFSDNAWKLIVFTLSTRSLIADGHSADFASASQLKATLALLVFLIPMLFFSLPGGVLADLLCKRSIIIGTRSMEIMIMGGAVLTLWLEPTQLLLPYILLALMGAQSAIFSPSKYGILPEILPQDRLSRGNGLMEMWTMLAIIAGTGLGPIIMAADRGGTHPEMSWWGPVWLIGLSVIGFLASWTIPRISTPFTSAAESCGVYSGIRKAWKSIQSDRTLKLAIFGGTFYWLILSLLGQNVLVYAKALVHQLQKGELLQGVPPASYGIGIALGALLGGRMSGDRIEHGLIPLGAILFATMALMLGIIQPAMSGTVVVLVLMGMGSGLLIVPLNALIQWRAPPDKRGSVISLGNALNIIAMIIGSLVASGMAFLGFTLGKMFIASSILVIIATVWAVYLLPQALIRLVFIILTRTIYRLSIVGFENIPKTGSALLVSNHLSLADAFFVLAAVDRPVHFIMKESYYNKWWIKPFASIMQAIPIPDDPSHPRAIVEAMRDAGSHLEQGHLVCIFPEGQTSLTGMLQPFHRGLELVARGHTSPIIPIYLDRIWGSIFSFQGGGYYVKRPKRIPYPLTVSFGALLSSDSSVFMVRQAVQELGYAAWMARKQDQHPIHHYFVHNVRSVPWRMAVADETHPGISRLSLLTSAILLAQALKVRWEGQSRIGILLPTSVEAVIANLAVALGCRTVVNLNYTLNTSMICHAIQQTELKTILASRKYTEQTNIEVPPGIDMIYIEDLLGNHSAMKSLSAKVLGLIAPLSMLEKACGASVIPSIEDILTISFTRGSTGKAKAVMLTHFNVNANVEGISQVSPWRAQQDKLLGALPFYHSFGYMVMWLGLNHGPGIVLHSDPLEAQAIGRLIKKQKVTFVMTTPAFLKAYLQGISSEQFGSVDCVLAGAEKLTQQLSDDIVRKFGIRPIEGYGSTECSPVITTSTLDIRAQGVFQKGSVPGTVGQPLPGVAVRIVNPDTYEMLPPDNEGLLLVKGPNVMHGYLHCPDKTEQIMHNGWYITGDRAVVDEQGYVRIIDRQT